MPWRGCFVAQRWHVLAEFSTGLLLCFSMVPCATSLTSSRNPHSIVFRSLFALSTEWHVYNAFTRVILNFLNSRRRCSHYLYQEWDPAEPCSHIVHISCKVLLCCEVLSQTHQLKAKAVWASLACAFAAIVFIRSTQCSLNIPSTVSKSSFSHLLVACAQVNESNMSRSPRANCSQ